MRRENGEERGANDSYCDFCGEIIVGEPFLQLSHGFIYRADDCVNRTGYLVRRSGKAMGSVCQCGHGEDVHRKDWTAMGTWCLICESYCIRSSAVLPEGNDSNRAGYVQASSRAGRTGRLAMSEVGVAL